MIDEQTDELISEVIDWECGEAQWAQFVTRAEAQPQLWRALAESQRDELKLSHVMAEATTVAATVEAPVFEGLRARRADRTFVVRQWSGWAIAAVVMLAAALNLNLTQRDQNATRTADVISPLSSAADAFNAYIQRGRESGQVVAEVPDRVLVETRPASTGKGFELLYLRQVLERTVVPDLYQVNGQNELGQPTLVRYQLPVRSSM